jgi:parallel beta-helix repeat protein
MWRYRAGNLIGVRIGLFLLAVVLSLIPCCWAAGRETTLRVKSGESIQAAIDAAPEGASIDLEAGIWEENLVIEKSLTLRGSGKGEAVLRSAREGMPVVWIWISEEEVQTVSVTLEGLSIGGAFGYDPHWPERGAYGVLVQDNVRVEITRCTISANRWSGIALLDDAEVIVRESTISENDWYGIWLWDAATVTILDSRISTNSGGIWFQGTSSGELRGTIVSDNCWKGMWFDQSARVSVVECSISKNGEDGIRVGNYAQATVVDNQLFENEGYGVGLLQSTCCGAVFHGYVAGRGNVIPNPGEEGGNAKGGFFPSELEFLITTKGSEWVGEPAG